MYMRNCVNHGRTCVALMARGELASMFLATVSLDTSAMHTPPNLPLFIAMQASTAAAVCQRYQVVVLSAVLL